jgi:hypothetical protein
VDQMLGSRRDGFHFLPGRNARLHQIPGEGDQGIDFLPGFDFRFIAV